jgi:glycosyltransferase involved in cell wall biosynthesis
MFSVIIPTYNRPQTLQRVLTSLEKQSLPLGEFEVLVAITNDDLSLDWLKAFKTSLKLIPVIFSDTKFQGKSASLKRNIGAQHAQFPWLAFIDDDCEAHEDWLMKAKEMILKQNTVAMEGFTQIPKPATMTFTYKGLKKLEHFGGYQTCNMFYLKKYFDDIGGFDMNLPFYMEDTDIAWSFLEKNHKITPNEHSIVYHPVPPANVGRWLDNAFRCRYIPYLYKKHPELFKKNGFRALTKSHLMLLTVILLVTLFFSATLSLTALLLGLLLYLGLSSFYVLFILRNCSSRFSERFMMILIYPLIPPISFIQLMRGNLEQRVFVFP